ncbi:MAG: hypothetical protein NUW37_08285 [Planctomycetes bacterium]|nr:hypothetical protein [Planctomycetota bacterium]
MKNAVHKALFAMLIVAAFSQIALADKVYKKGGDPLEGEITGLSFTAITLTREVSGQSVRMEVQRSDLAPPYFERADESRARSLRTAFEAFAANDFNQVEIRAKEALESRSSTDVDKQESWYLICRSNEARGRHEQTISSCDQFIEAFANTWFKAEALEMSGKAAVALGQLSRARNSFSSLASLPGFEATGGFWDAWIAVQQEDYAQAKAKLERILESLRSNESAKDTYGRALALLGICYLKADNDKAKAVEMFRQAFEVGFSDDTVKSIAANLLGDDAYAAGNYQEAQKWYMRNVVIYSRGATPEMKEHALCRAAVCLNRLAESESRPMVAEAYRSYVVRLQRDLLNMNSPHARELDCE